MKVSEIEGDAILFYKLDEVPSVKELLAQSERMFLDFHDHLKQYEVRRICNCGACTGVSNLSLKVIIHQGEIGFTNVRNVSKPFGKELVLSHRLLKNNAESKEYVLLSDTFKAAISNERESFPSWTKVLQGTDNYSNIGDVSYHYIPLTTLRDKIAKPQPPPPPKRKNKPLTHEVTIDCPPAKVYNVLVNLELRQIWNDDVKEVVFEKERVNRVGTRHQCLFPVGMAEFESFTDNLGDDKMVYGEQVMDIPFTETLNVYYILTKNDDSSTLKIELHHFPVPIIGWVMAPFLKMKMIKGVKKGAAALKRMCEED